MISLSRMLCFGRVCASPCALNVSAALQGSYTSYEVLEDGEVRRRLETGIFFKSSIIHSSCQKFLAEIAVTDYIKQVVEFESVIFYVMERDKSSFCSKAHFVVMCTM